MPTILYHFSDGHNEEIEVTEEFAESYAEMKHREYLVNRKETRRHLSLDKSMKHGFDVADPRADICGCIFKKRQSDITTVLR